MTVDSTTLDPYSADRGYFECRDCANREVASERLTECPDCGGQMRNIAVPRE